MYFICCSRDCLAKFYLRVVYFQQLVLTWPLIYLLHASTDLSRRTRIGCILLLSCFSFLTPFVWSLDPHLVFYSLPFRMWEFGVGALAAEIHQQFLSLSSSFRSDITNLGSLAFVYAAVCTNPVIDLPRPWSLLPVLSTMIILLGASDSLVGRILSLRIFTDLGNMSFSLCLVFWPALALAQTVTTITVWNIGLVMVAVLPLAWSFCKYVEQPVQHKLIRSHWFLFCVGLLACLCIGAAVVGKIANPPPSDSVISVLSPTLVSPPPIVILVCFVIIYLDFFLFHSSCSFFFNFTIGNYDKSANTCQDSQLYNRPQILPLSLLPHQSVLLASKLLKSKLAV